MMMYREFKEMKQKEFNALPTMFAFSMKQLEEQMKQYNATKEEIVSLGAGMFMRKQDVFLLDSWEAKMEAMQNELMKNDEFVLSAFLYELRNHEYIITYEVEDALEALDLSVDIVKQDKRLLKLINKAMRIVEKEDSCYV